MTKRRLYTFYDSWQPNALGLVPNEQYRVLADLGPLQQGAVVTYAGFDDVDNHFGIFVFVDAQDEVLEVRGDFSGSASVAEVKMALARLP